MIENNIISQIQRCLEWKNLQTAGNPDCSAYLWLNIEEEPIEEGSYE
jgi:hypothetical protein